MSDGVWVILMSAVFTPVIVGFMELYRALRITNKRSTIGLL